MARAPTGPRVEFAQAVRAIRPPREDELSVMRHFSSHASRCRKCADPYRTWKDGGELCDKGHSLARDVAGYIYSRGAKPFSLIDRENGDRIEIEVPVGCEAVRGLVKAFDRGMSLQRRKKQPVIVSQDPNYYVSERREAKRYDDRADVIEVTPGSSRTDRKEREKYYKEKESRRRPVIYYDSQGSLYRRDEESKQARKRYEEEPVIIYAEPRKSYRR